MEVNGLSGAIAALAVAKTAAKGIDLSLYEAALSTLTKIHCQILLHDQRMAESESVPTGDDYNDVLSMLGLTSDHQEIGRLWWNAESVAEAEQWKLQYLAKGAVFVEIMPEDDRPVVSVFITLNRKRAKDILGYEVGEDEWLDLSEAIPPKTSSALQLAVRNDRYADTIVGGRSDLYDGLEIQGVRDLNLPESPEGTCIEVDYDNPQFFSVYAHLKEGGVECVGDFGTYPLANGYAKELFKQYGWPIHDHVSPRHK